MQNVNHINNADLLGDSIICKHCNRAWYYGEYGPNDPAYFLSEMPHTPAMSQVFAPVRPIDKSATVFWCVCKLGSGSSPIISILVRDDEEEDRGSCNITDEYFEMNK